jgi:hypothetical protein
MPPQRRQPPVDIWTYFAQRERDFAELSLFPDSGPGAMFTEEAGSNGKRGRIFGRLWLAETIYLAIHETAVVVDDHVHREEYGYYLVADGEEVWGEERDLSHDPPVHRHIEGHVRADAEPISFKAAVAKAWEEVSRRQR